ncbi:MAG: LAGLIDADG family homing endonuclease [Gemmatimonadota bacterium]
MADTPYAQYLTFLTEPDAAEILERARRTETYYPDQLAADVLRSKYLAPGEDGPLELWERVARALASVEEDPAYWFEEFFDILFDFKFVPGGRVMHGAGREDARRRPTLSNCYVIPITEDSLDGIYQCLYESAMVYRTGGGVGTDLSILRPKGAPVNATVAGSPGSTSFMNLLSESTNTVSQAGRRGALMLTMRVDHPDIENFITIKNDHTRRKVQHANVSCLITHEFMDAVMNDTDFELRWGGTVFKTLRARELWTRIIENAHASAEPGIIFWDTMREHHNVEYANPLVSTNPCVTGDTLVYTADGLRPIAELAAAGDPLTVAIDGRFGAGGFAPASAPFASGVKPVYRLSTEEGFEIRLTKDHRLMTPRGWVAAKDLKPGEAIHVLDHKGGFGIEGTTAEGRVLGWLIADGHITGESGHGAVLGFWGEDRELADEFAADVNQVLGQDPESARYPVGVVDVPSRNLAAVSSTRLREQLATTHGITADNKLDGLPRTALRASEGFQRGLLQSLFTADGHVSGHAPTGVSVRLTSISLPLLQDVQRALLNFGVFSRIYANRHPIREQRFGEGIYTCQPDHDLVIGRPHLGTFMSEIGFLSTTKRNTLLNRLCEYQDKPVRKRKFVARFEKLEYDTKEVVFDVTEYVCNSFVANGLVAHNCGEQPLAGYTACNLGSINLSRFVTAAGEMDYVELAEVARTATRFLDNVIDYNMEAHALPKIRDAVASDRRIGLGITGLADALVQMRIRYDSDEALQTVDRVMETICRSSYQMTIDLAREKGAFPLFSWDGISQSRFIQQLPAELQEQIKQYGMRNATVLTVPPVGTGSIVAQSSSGVEPIFCTSYRRRVKQADGESFAEYVVYHPLIQQLWGDDEELPDFVVTSHDIDPYFRVRMQGTIQRWVDSSISSTVNLPTEVSVETVADIYVTAYKAGLKGITVYREGSREGILVTDRETTAAAARATEAAQASEAPLAAEAPLPAEAPNGNGHEPTRLKPRPRPAITHGVTERIRTGDGNLYVTINEDDAGMCEVFASLGKAGGSAAAQSEAMCRLISLGLRSGLDPQSIVRELKGISGPNPVWDNGELILSAPDAIGRALERCLDRRGESMSDGRSAAVATATGGSARAEDVIRAAAESESFQGPGAMPARPMSSCPECGYSMVHEGGCLRCMNCGWTRC